jgi:hypothetical protein
MSIPFHIRPMYQRGLDEFIRLDCTPTGEIRPHEVSENEEYHLIATIVVPFWANRAQLNTAKRIAAQVVQQELYRDVLQELPRLRLAISNGDRTGAYVQCDRIKQVCSDVERLFQDDRSRR